MRCFKEGKIGPGNTQQCAKLREPFSRTVCANSSAARASSEYRFVWYRDAGTAFWPRLESVIVCNHSPKSVHHRGGKFCDRMRPSLNIEKKRSTTASTVRSWDGALSLLDSRHTCVHLPGSKIRFATNADPISPGLNTQSNGNRNGRPRSGRFWNWCS